MKVTEEHILTLTFYIMISGEPEVSFLLCCLNLTKGEKRRGGCHRFKKVITYIKRTASTRSEN